VAAHSNVMLATPKLAIEYSILLFTTSLLGEHRNPIEQDTFITAIHAPDELMDDFKELSDSH
jgi:hypothetical protein